MSIPFHEKIKLPHAVYRMFSGADELLYLGMSRSPLSRTSNHFAMQPWRQDVTRVTIEWFPNWDAAALAEGVAIRTEGPKYNKFATGPGHTPGADTLRHAGTVKKGDGTVCPRCGGPKQHKPGLAYCPPCSREYRAERKAKQPTKPVRTPTVTCPRCGGIKQVRRDYCPPCKKQINAEYQKSRKQKQVP